MAMGKIYLAARGSRAPKGARRKRRYRKSKFEKVPRLLKDGYPSDQVACTFVYSSRGTADLTTTAYAHSQIACNSIFDPEYGTWDANITGERNAQPRYRDAVMGVLYDSYRVVGATLEVVFQNTAVDESMVCKCYAYQVPSSGVNDTNITSAGLVDEHPFMGRGNGKSVLLGALRGGNATKKITLSWNERELNLRDRMDNENDAGTSPSAGLDPYWQIGIITHDGTAGTSSVQTFYKVKYHCILTDPVYANIS